MDTLLKGAWNGCAERVAGYTLAGVVAGAVSGVFLLNVRRTRTLFAACLGAAGASYAVAECKASLGALYASFRRGPSPVQEASAPPESSDP